MLRLYTTTVRHTPGHSAKCGAMSNRVVAHARFQQQPQAAHLRIGGGQAGAAVVRATGAHCREPPARPGGPRSDSHCKSPTANSLMQLGADAELQWKSPLAVSSETHFSLQILVNPKAGEDGMKQKVPHPGFTVKTSDPRLAGLVHWRHGKPYVVVLRH